MGVPSTLSVGSLQTSYQNGTGSTMAMGIPVSTNTSGQLVLTDATNEATVLAMVGLTAIAIPSAAIGSVIDSGRLQNVSTAFSVGDPLYVGSTPGTLTNIPPAAGSNGFVEGDYCIFVGVLVQNEFNPSNTDIKLLISVVGEL
jgi:hypothetical protein